MKNRIVIFLKLYAFWMILFIVLKILFMLYNYRESFELPFTVWIQIIYHGILLDLSAGAYLMFIPGMLILSGAVPGNTFYIKGIDIYTYIFLFIILFLGIADMALYSYWGFKLDLTPVLMYIKTPGDALASVNLVEMILLVLIFAGIFILFIKLYNRFVRIPAQLMTKTDVKTFIAMIIMICVLLLPARGGMGIAPVNLGTVYFHSDRFVNHSAINVLWNTIYSLSEKNKMNTSFHFMTDEKANELFVELYPDNMETSERIVKEGANIILIILESFSNKIIEPLGGEHGITPHFNDLCREGMLFTKFFASGDRSDKGLVSIFSGFPAQPLTSIINYPAKSQKLPFIKDSFHNKGYCTAFYYGGNLDFASFRSYFTRKSIDNIVDMNSFPRSFRKQKWGVPDNYVYERILNDLENIKQPFFISFFTLSSHEPFDIPVEPFFGSSGRDNMSRSAFYFADQCLGDFITLAKQKPWWDNTLIVMMSDHGSRSPGNTPNHSREKFSIPMLWFGGALLATPGINNAYSSQVDLPATLMTQFGHDHTAFRYSRDIFTSSRQAFAYYSFHNGFGFFRDSVELIYDNSAEMYIFNSGRKAELWQEHAKAMLQVITNDFLTW